jgi:ABC-type lipoprotein export system ATPase subunit
MDQSTIKTYRTVAAVQSAIGNARTLDAALREGLRVMASEMGVESCIMWYADGHDGRVLRPYFWLAIADFTQRRATPGVGVVGRVFESRRAERLLDYRPGADPESEELLVGHELRSMVAVPFSTLQTDLGVLQFINKTDGTPFTDEEADALEMLAMLAALAVDESEELSEPKPVGEAIIQVRGVTREYVNGDNVTKVLKGVNLDVYEGEFLVLLGESGCGKSTLMNIIAGMDAPTSGSVEFCGQQIVGASQSQLTEYRRDNIGFIFQSYNLMPNLTARQNLELIAELVDDPMPAAEALELVGLGERKDNYPSQMSGGQQQRVSIARALVKRPRIIFADEPTAALDYSTSIEVLQVMERVVATGTTMVMVTHNEEICRMADRVVRMRDGRTHEVTVNRVRVGATDLVW